VWNCLKIRAALAGILAMTMISGTAASQPPTTARQLWAEYVKNPNAHPNIPNCSYAGYRYGESPLPTARVVVSVRDLGAKADGQTDDAAAFARAIDAAAKAGGGAVLVPAGTYALDGMIRLTANGVVLRGEGPEKTILHFRRSLSDVLGPLRNRDGSSQYSWCGGLIWIGPADTFAADGRLDGGLRESWRGGARLAAVSAAAKRGDFVVRVDNPAALKAGDRVLMTWDNPEDLSLMHWMAGHPLMEKYDWRGAGAGLVGTRRWLWPVQIQSVSEAEVRLRQPLRVDVRPEWKVGFEALGPVISEAGVESLGMRFDNRRPYKHLTDEGFNGIYLNRAWNCFVRDVAIRDAQNGVIHAAAKNTTVVGLRLAGRDHHHATALRVASHDNLITDFVIESRPHHGINTEALSTGNVWRNGDMKNGTFDSHRAMSFELIRTNITINNNGRPGGANTAGPFLGARCVHWNVRITNGNAEWVYQPDAISSGALVGIQGSEPSNKAAWAMVEGDKGCIVADHGRVPEPADLYEAQLRLRLGR